MSDRARTVRWVRMRMGILCGMLALGLGLVVSAGYELMIKANTPGERDGRITIWFDGVLAADFGNLRLRDIDSLKIDRFGVGFHIHSNPGGLTKKWYDNVVAASSYIGPMVPR